MAMIAFVLFLALAREFEDGLPPRFVVNGIPNRIERLRPGMTYEQTRDILGLEKSWLHGGTDARLFSGEGNGHVHYEEYHVRPMRRAVVNARVRGGPPEPVIIFQSPAMIQLKFRTDIRSAHGWNWRKDDSTRLEWAAFSSDFRTIAEMPRPR